MKFWRRLKFWRHLVVVSFAVAVVVVLGVVWERSSAADWITPPGPPIPAKIAGPAPVGGEVVRIRAGGESGMWLDLSDVGNLTSTAEIVAAVMAGVIVLDIGRRRWRKARRAAAVSASSPET